MYKCVCTNVQGSVCVLERNQTIMRITGQRLTGITLSTNSETAATTGLCVHVYG